MHTYTRMYTHTQNTPRQTIEPDPPLLYTHPDCPLNSCGSPSHRGILATMLPLVPSGHPEEIPVMIPMWPAGKDIVYRGKNLEC